MSNPAPPEPPLTFFVTATVEGIEAITDAGRSIPLLRYEAVAILPAGQQLSFQSEQQRNDFLNAMEQKFLSNTGQDPKELTKLAHPHPQSNCHGWVFAEGRFGVPEASIPTILADNGYAVTEEPREGDIAVFTRDNEAKHSGLVRANARGAVQIESKWGPFGVYLHGPEAHPFSKVCTYFRTARGGHLLPIAPTTT